MSVGCSTAAAQGQRRGLRGSQKDCQQAVDYLRRFARCMKYRDYRRVGLPIGNGVTEAACKTIFNYRFKQSAMRWHCATGQHVLDLRVILKSGVWQRVYQAPAAVVVFDYRHRRLGRRSRWLGEKSAQPVDNHLSESTLAPDEGAGALARRKERILR